MNSTERDTPAETVILNFLSITKQSGEVVRDINVEFILTFVIMILQRGLHVKHLKCL